MNQSLLLSTPTHAYIHSMVSRPNMLSHPHQSPIQGDEEIFHPVPNQHLPPFPFDGILPLQEYGILPHSRTYYCLLFSLYHMFIVFVISY